MKRTGKNSAIIFNRLSGPLLYIRRVHPKVYYEYRTA